MGEEIKVGVIGTGAMGARHARNLATLVPDVTLSALMDADQARAKALSKACGGVRVFDDGVALIQDPDVDAVLVASPDATHAELALACLEAKKPVLLEKPLASDLERAAAVVKAEAALERRFIQLGFMRAFDALHRDVEAVARAGDLGRLLMFRGVHNNLLPGAVRDVHDVATNSAVHDFHSARWLVADEVSAVTARSVPAVADRPESCRLLLVQLAFRGGAVGTIEVNADAGYGYEVRVEITGESGIVGSDDASGPMVRRKGAKSARIAPDWLERFEQAYVDEIRAWAASLGSGQVIGPSAWDGYMSLAIADATVRSVRTGMPVDVTSIERPAIYAEG